MIGAVVSQGVGGKIVLVTGPARGIGAETARNLARRGARLALVGKEPARLAALGAELGPGHRWFECDVTVQAELDRAIAETVAAFGGIDVVVANAGIAAYGTLAVTPVEALARVLEVNLIGVVRTVKTALPWIIERRGYLLIVSSAAAIAPCPGLAVYAASKSGVEQLANALRVELAGVGVQVGSAHPCWIDTDLVRDTQNDFPSFGAMIRSLPGPFGTVTSVERCADALADAIERRRRKVFVPRSLGPLAVIRQLFASPLAEAVLRRRLGGVIGAHGDEAAALGRSFGRNSVGMGSRSRSESGEELGNA